MKILIHIEIAIDRLVFFRKCPLVFWEECKDCDCAFELVMGFDYFAIGRHIYTVYV